MNNLQNNQLNELYTIEARLRYGELPVSFKENFLGYGWRDLNGEPIDTMGYIDAIRDDEISYQFVTVSGRLKKHKCIFIHTYDLAIWLRDFLQQKMIKKYPSIVISIRKVNGDDLNYRKKKAIDEALENDEKIKVLMDK